MWVSLERGYEGSQKEGEGVKKVRQCEMCGKEFEYEREWHRFCSHACHYAFKREENARMKRREREQLRLGENRAFTTDTADIIKRWHSNGDSVESIASMLKRPVAVILDVLADNEGKYETIDYRTSENKAGSYSKRKAAIQCKVRCIDTGVVYESQEQAGEQTGISPSCISQCCAGRSKTAGGYRWEKVK